MSDVLDARANSTPGDGGGGGASDVTDLETSTGTEADMLRVAAAGGLEYRTAAQILSDINAEAAGAAAAAQAAAVQRANHTGTQLASTISDLGTMALEDAADYLPLSGGTLTGALAINGSADAVQQEVRANAAQTANLQEWQSNGGAVLASVGPLGKVYISSQALLGTPVAGTIEFADDRMYITNVGAQRSIDRTSDVIVDTVTVTNTTVETVIYTGSIPANALKVGNVLKVILNGLMTNASAADDITLRQYIGAQLVQEFIPSTGFVSNGSWSVENAVTVRSVGVASNLAVHGHIELAGSISQQNSVEVIDTTIPSDITVTIQWSNAKAGNTISLLQGMLEFKN